MVFQPIVLSVVLEEFFGVEPDIARAAPSGKDCPFFRKVRIEYFSVDSTAWDVGPPTSGDAAIVKFHMATNCPGGGVLFFQVEVIVVGEHLFRDFGVDSAVVFFKELFESFSPCNGSLSYIVIGSICFLSQKLYVFGDV